MPSSTRVCAMTETKSVRPRMNSIVSAWIRSSRPWNDSRCCRIQNHQPLLGDLDVPRRRRQPAERRDDDQQHPVGERVLVDLVAERSEEEQAEDRGQDFGREQPDRHRRRRGRRAGWRRRRPRSRRRTTSPAASRRPAAASRDGRLACEAPVGSSVVRDDVRWCFFQLRKAAPAMPSAIGDERRAGLEQQAGRQDARPDEDTSSSFPHHNDEHQRRSSAESTSAGTVSGLVQWTLRTHVCFSVADLLHLLARDRQLQRVGRPGRRPCAFPLRRD